MEIIYKTSGGNPNRRSAKPYFGQPELRALAISGYNGSEKWVSYLGSHLQNLGLVCFRKREFDGRYGVYHVTRRGHESLEHCGYGLPWNASAPDDRAGVDHFVSLAELSIKLHDCLPIEYWLTDFLVHSENHIARDLGFAKDYDAVFQTLVQGRPFTVAVELETSEKAAERYLEIAQSYSSDKYAHMILFIVDRQPWIASIAQAMGAASQHVCFVERSELLAHPINECSAFRFVDGAPNKNWLSLYMMEAARQSRPCYAPKFTSYPQ